MAEKTPPGDISRLLQKDSNASQNQIRNRLSETLTNFRTQVDVTRSLGAAQTSQPKPFQAATISTVELRGGSLNLGEQPKQPTIPSAGGTIPNVIIAVDGELKYYDLRGNFVSDVP